MLMIIFLCLSASLTSVFGDKDVGKNFDWDKVGISVSDTTPETSSF